MRKNTKIGPVRLSYLKFRLQRLLIRLHLRRKALRIASVLILLAMIEGSFLLFFHPAVQAAWFDDSYAYRQTTSFTHNADITSERRVTITIDTATLISAGKMQADCDDSRFTDLSGKVLRYQLTGSCNNASTTYDVVFPAVYNAVNKSYFYYGNPSAKSGSDTNVASVTSVSPSGGTPTIATEEKSLTPLLAWKFDEGAGTTAYDASSQANNGTLSATSNASVAVKIDDASNFGAILGFGRNVVRTTGGTLYSFINKAGSCQVWKSTNGTSWSEQDSGNHKTCINATPVAMAIDSTDNLHLIYDVQGTQKDVRYVKFTTSTDTFGSEEVVRAGSNNDQASPYMDIAIDSNDKPHATFLRQNSIFDLSIEYYSNRVSGSWKTPVVIDSGAAATDFLGYNSLTFSNTNIPIVTYTYGASTTLKSALGNVNDAASFTLTSIDTTINVTTSTNDTSTGIDSNGNIWIAYVDASTNYITLVKHNNGDAWSTWQSSVTDSHTGKEPSIAVNGTDVYVFYQNSVDDIAYDKYSGSWSGETTLETGTYQDTHAKWAAYNNNQGSTQIDYLFSDATDIYWNKLSLSAAGTTPTFANEDSCAISKCLQFSSGYVKKTYTADTELDPSTESFTASAWFRHGNTISSIQTILSRADGVNGVGYKLYMNASGFICFGIDSAAGSFPSDSACSTTSYADSNWHMVEGVKSTTSSITLFIDGKQIIQDASITGSTISGTSSPFIVGADADSDSNPWVGSIDEVKYYNFAKTTPQILLDFTARGGVLGAASSVGDKGTTFLNQGLVGYWKMDDNTGTTTVDSSGNSITGTLTNGPTWGSGKFGNGITFDGTNDYIDVTSNTLSFGAGSSFSISGWFKTSTTGTRQGIYGVNSLSGQYIAVFVFTDNTIEMETNDSNGSYLNAGTVTTVTDGAWHHYVAIRDASDQSIKFYLDGKLAERTADTRTGNFDSTENYIGRDQSSFYMNGSIDDTRIYNRALSASEITSLYEWAPEPIGYWNFDDHQGTTTAADISGNGNTGTISNGIPSDWTQGKFGTGLNFDTNRHTKVDAGAPALFNNLSQFSTSMWIYPKSKGGNNEARFIDKSASTGPTNGWYFKFDSGSQTMMFQVDYNTTDLVRKSTNTIPFNEWSYITLTWDGSTSASNVHMYLNGIEVTYTGSVDGVGTRADDTTGDLKIGDQQGSNWRTFDGTFDDVKLYNYIMTPKPIIKDMNAGHPFVGTPVGAPVGHWSLDEGYGSANDKSPNSNTLSSGGLISGSMYTQSGKIGKAFHGTGNNWMTRADDSDFDFGAGQDFSISLWARSIRGTPPSTDEYIVSKESSSAGYAIWFNTNGEIVCGIDDDASGFPEDSAGDTAANKSFYDTAWHHIVCVRDTAGGRLNLYIDGKLFDSDTSLSATGDLSNSDSLTFASRNTTNDTDDFFGDLDEIKIYRAAENADDVKVEYNQGKAISIGSLSTDADGTATNSAVRSYCPPGNTESNCATGQSPAPVGEWTLDEGTGTSANDTSINGQTGTLQNSATWGTGKIGKAAFFNGTTNNQVVVTQNTPINITSSFTLEAWVNPSSLSACASGCRDVITKTSGGSDGNYYVELDSGEVLFGFFGGGGFREMTTSGAGITTSTWSHITGVFDDSANTLTVYVNGKFVSESTGITQTPTADSNNLKIGAGYVNESFVGSIDQVRIFNYARSQAQVAWDYNRGGPVGKWKLDECSGTTIHDTSGNGKDGTWSGSSGSQTSAGTCLTSSTAWGNGASGKFNASLNFDGSDDKVSIGNVSPYQFDRSNPFSLSIWFKTTTNGGQSLIAKMDHDTSDRGYELQTGFGALFFQIVNTISTNGIEKSATISYNDGLWHHFVGTYDGSSSANGMFLYLDGKQLTTSTSFNNLSATITTTAPLQLGIRTGSSVTQPFTGQLDEARVYNYALSAAQVKTLYNEDTATRFGP